MGKYVGDNDMYAVFTFLSFLKSKVIDSRWKSNYYQVLKFVFPREMEI